MKKKQFVKIGTDFEKSEVLEKLFRWLVVH